jgi:hypothetical protein
MQKMTIKTGIILLLLTVCLTNCFYCGAQTIKGRLSFKGNDLAKGLKVILVPRTTDNERITGNNFFLADDQNLLEKMHAVVSYTNNDGYYFFSKIRAGRYILKVCCAYGMVYKFTVPNSYQVLVIKNLPASYNNQRFY